MFDSYAFLPPLQIAGHLGGYLAGD
jgi:hypothetical protein